MPQLILVSPEFANQSCVLLGGMFTVGRTRKNVIFPGSVELLGTDDPGEASMSRTDSPKAAFPWKGLTVGVVVAGLLIAYRLWKK